MAILAKTAGARHLAGLAGWRAWQPATWRWGRASRRRQNGLPRTRTRCTEREEEYQEYAQLWRGLVRTYAGNSLASGEIEGLLAKAERDYTSIKNGWKQGTLGYPQVLKAFDLLVRSLRLGLIAIDDDHSVDVHGPGDAQALKSLRNFWKVVK